MHQQSNTSASKKAKPVQSIVLLLVFTVLFFICLSYNLYKLNHRKTHYTQTTLSLPELEDEPEDKLAEAAKKDEWTTITTHPRDTLGSVFKQLGLSQQTLQAVLHDNPHAKKLTNIKLNQQIQFLIHDHVLEQMLFPINATQVLEVSRQNNRYVSKINARQMNSHNQFLTATVQGSLFGTAQRLHLPYKLVKQMTDIFNWEIDFAKDIRAGDQFSILYKAFYIDDKLISTGDILAVSYTNRGKTHHAIRHATPYGGHDYFNPQGISLKKAFSRYPLKFSHISSTFSLSRKHPILHYSRPHKGIDLAAPLGTPIYATGDGYIHTIGHQSDYGNMIKVIHDKTYASIYGHLLKFEKGLTRGSRVKRGQVIGYVGQTGLATGPHCHYEVHINQQPRNPATIELPRATPISARDMATFKATAGTLLARLKLYEEGHLAGATVKKSAKTG